jgi:hypothetical protein
MHAFRRIFLVVALGGAIGAGALAGTASAQSYASTLSATVEDCSRVTVSGAEWEPNADITISIASSSPVTLGTVESNDDGAFTASFPISSSLGNGDHVINAVSEFSSSSVGVTLSSCANARALATTGANTFPWVTAGVGLILIGTVLALITYRRRAAQSLGV